MDTIPPQVVGMPLQKILTRWSVMTQNVMNGHNEPLWLSEGTDLVWLSSTIRSMCVVVRRAGTGKTPSFYFKLSHFS